VHNDQLDPGEAEAIGLALQMKVDWLLTDDAQARRFAERLALEVHGSVGLLLWAVAAGHLHDREQANAALDALTSSSLWISKRVLREARKAIDILFEN
jgi:predicted nucleic acid-binding protein